MGDEDLFTVSDNGSPGSPGVSSQDLEGLTPSRNRVQHNRSSRLVFYGGRESDSSSTPRRQERDDGDNGVLV